MSGAAQANARPPRRWPFVVIAIAAMLALAWGTRYRVVAARKLQGLPGSTDSSTSCHGTASCGIAGASGRWSVGQMVPEVSDDVAGLALSRNNGRRRVWRVLESG